MGFEPEEERMPTVYVSVLKGSLTTRAKENEAGAVKRENKNGVIVWEHHHKNGVSGVLQNITAAKNPRIDKNPWEFIIELRDATTKFKISIPADSRYGDDLACKIPSLEYGVQTVVKPFDFEDKENKEKKITGISFIQDGAKVPRFITKENPMGRPVLEKEVDDDEYKIFQLQVRKFYREMVLHHSNTEKGVPAQISTAATETASSQAPPPAGDEDDLPFIITALLGIGPFLQFMI